MNTFGSKAIDVMVSYLIQDSKNLDPWIKELAQYRAALCPQCVDAGRCVGGDGKKGCGCNSKKIMTLPNRRDSAGRWGPVVDEQAWGELKKLKNIVFKNGKLISYDN